MSRTTSIRFHLVACWAVFAALTGCAMRRAAQPGADVPADSPRVLNATVVDPALDRPLPPASAARAQGEASWPAPVQARAQGEASWRAPVQARRPHHNAQQIPTRLPRTTTSAAQPAQFVRDATDPRLKIR